MNEYEISTMLAWPLNHCEIHYSSQYTTEVMRVPGGWMYTKIAVDDITGGSVFVPEPPAPVENESPLNG